MKNAVYYLPGYGGLLAVRRKRLAGFDGSDVARFAGADFFEVSGVCGSGQVMIRRIKSARGCSLPRNDACMTG